MNPALFALSGANSGLLPLAVLGSGGGGYGGGESYRYFDTYIPNSEFLDNARVIELAKTHADRVRQRAYGDVPQGRSRSEMLTEMDAMHRQYWDAYYVLIDEIRADQKGSLFSIAVLLIGLAGMVGGLIYACQRL